MFESLWILLTHPLGILVIGLATIVVMLLVLRANAFVAFITAAMLVSMLAPGEPAGKIERVVTAFGAMAGKIGVLIALAAIIGKCLTESGGADRIVRSFLNLFGAARIPEALAAAAFLLAPMVFFGTAFYLIIPIARCFARHTRKDYLLYVLAIGSGGAVTHVMVPPAVGPLLIAANLHVDLGALIVAGTLIGLPTTLIGLCASRLLNRRMTVPVRPYLGEIERQSPSEEELPGLAASLAPVVLPLALILADTILRTFAGPSGPVAAMARVSAILGNPNMALLISAVVAMAILARTRHLSLVRLGGVAEEALTSCGVMILLVCAGAAFGRMLGDAQVGSLIEQVFPRGGEQFGGGHAVDRLHRHRGREGRRRLEHGGHCHHVGNVRCAGHLGRGARLSSDVPGVGRRRRLVGLQLDERPRLLARHADERLDRNRGPQELEPLVGLPGTGRHAGHHAGRLDLAAGVTKAAQIPRGKRGPTPCGLRPGLPSRRPRGRNPGRRAGPSPWGGKDTGTAAGPRPGPIACESLDRARIRCPAAIH